MNLRHTVCTDAGVYDFDADFLDADFKHVILAQGCGTLPLYLRAERAKRGRLQRAQRVTTWQLAAAYQAALEGPPRRTTYALIADRAARIENHCMARVEEQARYKEEHGGLDLIHREAGSGMWLKPRYQHIVVDEAQDLSASHWRMLRAMVSKGPNDIFLVGDAHQRIYSHHVVLGRLGIETRGRASRRLTLNYRTTHQILTSAHGLVDGESFDDLDAGSDDLRGYRSILMGLAPQFWRAPDGQTEMRAVATLVRERHDQYGTPYSAMAISVPDRAAASQMAFALASEPFNIPVTELTKDGPRSPEGVRIGTMHGFKGLEFQRVFLTGISDGQVPHQRIDAYEFTQPERHRQELQRARSLLFVAATRARDELVITWNGRASRFLPEDADRAAFSATELLTQDGPPSGSAAA
ncbi:3'-5' exonuclease [Streptomyces sp. NPDC021093]|uniref:3'-5' exonuclease n=1 Tax=Streptomyces sp. NPDC021093 TaxID=3365112 RepID=UPI0037B18681